MLRRLLSPGLFVGRPFREAVHHVASDVGACRAHGGDERRFNQPDVDIKTALLPVFFDARLQTTSAVNIAEVCVHAGLLLHSPHPHPHRTSVSSSCQESYPAKGFFAPRTSKWRWQPVERPVLPIVPMRSPAATVPPLTEREVRWA